MNDDEDGYTILVPGIEDDRNLPVKNGRFKITSRDMESLFSPIVEKVIALTQGQINSVGSTIRAVLLVGGFGQNNHLKECLRTAVGPKIEVLQPPDAWTAVVRGAVMMGLALNDQRLASVSLESRKARKHYGIELQVRFDGALHEERKR